MLNLQATLFDTCTIILPLVFYSKIFKFVKMLIILEQLAEVFQYRPFMECRSSLDFRKLVQKYHKYSKLDTIYQTWICSYIFNLILL